MVTTRVMETSRPGKCICCTSILICSRLKASCSAVGKGELGDVLVSFNVLAVSSIVNEVAFVVRLDTLGITSVVTLKALERWVKPSVLLDENFMFKCDCE